MMRQRLGHRGATALAAILLLTSGLAGCSCDPPPDETSLEITSPANGASLSLGSDTDSVQPGVQIDVTALAMGLSVGEDIRVEVDGVPAGGSTVPSDGIVTISGVTIDSGTHTLRATARSGGIVSDDVTVTVTDSCFAVAFVSPEAGDRLGGGDDTDGDACGATFETTVVATAAAPDGAEARILVNGSSRRTGTVQSGQVRFTGVGLDNRNGSANSLEVEVTADGVTCSASLPSGVFVDCDGASCTISAPVTDTPFLNTDDDTSAAEGFQGDFAVTTDASGANQDIRLIIDGDESGAPSATPSGMVATFDGVELTEGTHRFVAECLDDAGNVTRSGPAEWTVDITPCGVTLDNPLADTLFVDTDDLDLDPTNGIQVLTDGTAGSDCEGLRVDVCSGIEAAPFSASLAAWTQEVTLGSAAAQEICAQTQDAAGNISEAMVAVRVNTEAPQLEIASPTTGAAFNVAGTAGRIADLMGGSTTCEADFEVYCTGLGVDVELYLEASDATIATAACVEDVGAPAPFAGTASFAAASLPSVEDGSSFAVRARQTLDRLTGMSDPVSLQADCRAPALTVLRPTCGATLLPATQDENMATPEFEYRTVVTRTTDTELPVDLAIRTAGGAVVYMATDSTMGPSASFPLADYTSGGLLSVEASTVDGAGNVGLSAACTVTVEDLPEVVLTAPVMDQVFSDAPADDCSSDPGLQIQISGTTDAAAGSDVSVTVGGGAPTAGVVGAGGVISECVDAADGRSVTIEVTVTDTRGTGMASVVVLIDTMAPTDPISDLTVEGIPDRRGGIVQLGWTAQNDAGGERLTSYELRCSSEPIASEADWDAARSVMVTTTPGAAGAMHVEDVDAFRPGDTEFCVLRGVDPAGALTPLQPSTMVELPFLSTTAAAEVGMGSFVAAVGDINGDGVDDFLASGSDEAYLFFGEASDPPVLSTAPDVTFSNPGVGFSVAGLGDVSGDGIADFAMGDIGPGGSVRIFFGRPMAVAWPSTCDVVTTCVANVTISGFFLPAVSSAGDFDGDGSLDIAIGDGFFGNQVLVVLGPFADGSSLDTTGGVGTGPDGFVIAAPTGHMRFGLSVSTVGGDASGDGRHDLIIGNTTETSGTHFARGQVYPTPGSGLIALPSVNVTLIESDIAGHTLGDRVTALGDINGDGRLDVGAFAGDNAARGRVSLYLGDGSTYSSSAGSIFALTHSMADVENDRFGKPLALGRHPSNLLGTIGDLDRDGLADVLVGSDQEGASDGAAYLFYSSSTPADRLSTDANSIYRSSGTGTRSVGYVGDVNGDGFNDFVVTEPDAGALTIFY